MHSMHSMDLIDLMDLTEGGCHEMNEINPPVT
jgi:hypothetical protein